MGEAIAQVQVGPQGPSPNGAIIVQRGGRFGEAVANEFMPRYYEQAYNKVGFVAANQAVVTTTVGLALTYTGLVINNPIGSGVNLVMMKASWMQSVIQSTQIEGFGLAIGYNANTNVTQTASVTPQSTFVGSGTVAKALVASSAASSGLITAPTYSHFVGNTGTATQNNPGGVVDLEGSVILPPGGYMCWVTPTQASVNGMWFSYNWLEVTQ